ncbi:MAG: histidine phosphatase family protein [Pseudomonadota bacterium]
MSTLYLVRHGQARFLTDDYDRLSEVGHEQAKLVGEHFVKEDIVPSHVWHGTLKRQRDTAAGALAILSAAGIAAPDSSVLPGLDEYPADELMTFLLPLVRTSDETVDREATELSNCTDERQRYRLIHRLLEAVMRSWIDAQHDVSVAGIPTWAEWSGNVRAALKACMEVPSGSTVAVFTSGGPVGVAVQTMLAAPDVQAAELNWRVFNASVSRVTFSRSRVTLDSFNETGHLPHGLRTHR